MLVALYGPTSSGKTALSVELARRIERDLGRPVVIVSADSRQVYRYMDIGTSKTTRAEMGGIRHEMIDIVEPVRKLELEEYARLARPHLRTDGVALIVGGTGVYVKALLDGWTLEGVGQARDALRRDFPRSMAADAYAMLRRLDKTARVHPNNYEAVINALAARMAGPPGAAPAAHMVLGLDPGAAVIDRRVAATYDDQVRRGLFDEIQALAARYDLTRSSNQVLHTHGYREWFEVARERGKPLAALSASDRAEVRERVVEHIRGYTRRQRSWFAKLPGVRVVSGADQAFSHLSRRS